MRARDAAWPESAFRETWRWAVTWWRCPSNPPCEHAALFHDIEEYDDPRPRCCVEGCDCGKPGEGIAADGHSTQDPDLEALIAALKAELSAMDPVEQPEEYNRLFGDLIEMEALRRSG